MPLSSRTFLKRAEARGVPRILYKYCSEAAVPILTHLELKVTRPIEFNDPFEYSPCVGRPVSAKDLERLYEDNALIERWNLPPRQMLAGDADRGLLRKTMTEASRQLFKDELEEISAKWGVICLSAEPRSVLMWSHYAQNHQGFVIGLDHSKVAKMPLLPVVYDPRRVRFNAATPFRPKPAVRSYEVLCRKSPDWAYEQEFRMIWPLDRLIAKEMNGSLWYMMPLLPSMIAELILGVRASDALETRLKIIATALGRTLCLKRACLHTTDYKLRFERINY